MGTREPSVNRSCFEDTPKARDRHFRKDTDLLLCGARASQHQKRKSYKIGHFLLHIVLVMKRYFKHATSTGVAIYNQCFVFHASSFYTL